MAKVIHTCTGCVPIDASIIEAYVALLKANQDANKAEEDREAAEDERQSTFEADHEASVAATARANEAAERAENVGKYYGFYLTAADLPSDATDPGYAMVGATSPFAIYDFDGIHWTDSGATLDSIQGESAYDVAVDNGFVGTEEEWLASLVGPQGVKGDTGATGATGATGPKGDKGDQGNTGSSVSYPYELVNNRTTDDATKGLTAAEGKRLGDDIGSLSNLGTTNKSNLVAAINEAFLSSGGLEIVETIEAGLYFVDSSMRIGAYFNNTGFHSINNVEL